MKLLQIMFWSVPAHAEEPLIGLAAKRGGGGQQIQEEMIGLGECELYGVVVDFLQATWLAIDGHDLMPGRVQLLVQKHVFVPEDKVIGRERSAIAPFHTLAQEQGERPPLVGNLPVPDHVGHELFTPKVDVGQGVEGTAAIAAPLVGRPREAAMPGAAVGADGMQRFDYQRLSGQTLAYWRQLSLLHQGGQRRRFLELRRHPGRIGNDLGSLNGADEMGTHAWLIRRCRCLGCDAGQQHHQSQASQYAHSSDPLVSFLHGPFLL